MKATKRKAGVVGVFVLTLVLVACLDPINIIPEFTVPISGSLDASNSGWLTIANGSSTGLSRLSIVPAEESLVEQYTRHEWYYLSEWMRTLHLPPRNPNVLQNPTSGLRLRNGNYIIHLNGVELHTVSVQPENATNYGDTNIVTFIDAEPINPGKPTDPPVNPVLSAINFMTLFPFFSASSDGEHNYVTALSPGQSLTYSVTLQGTGTIAERQAVASKRVVTWGNLIDYNEGTARVTRRSDADPSNDKPGAWIEYRILAADNGGQEVWIRINF